MLNHDFKLAPSKYYLILLYSVYIISISAILYLPIFWLYKMLLIVTASFYGSGILNRYGRLEHPHSIISLLRDHEGKWRIFTKNSQYEALLSPESIVTHLVCVLIFKTINEDIPLNCVIFPDTLLKDEFRKLLVLLRMF